MANASYDQAFGCYKIASHDALEGLKRSKCKKCGCSRMYFCYKCHAYVDGIDETKLPTVSLPWKIDIIKHAKEVDGKSTAIHAALLAPRDVRVYTYPTIPDYSRDTNSLLVFPDKRASTMEEIFAPSNPKLSSKRAAEVDDCEISAKIPKVENGKEHGSTLFTRSGEAETKCNSDSCPLVKYKKIIFIDCTWSQAYGIFTDERICQLPTVKLNDLSTVYWRHNEEMPYTFLATIEAIYSFLKTSHQLMHGAYEGQFDNMLYFYSYFYKLVQKGADKGRKKQ